MYNPYHGLLLLPFLPVVTCLITGALAARKGYRFILWLFAGGIIGLILLAFLPFVNKGDFSEMETRQKTKTGNLLGGVISAITLVALAAWLIQYVNNNPAIWLR
jgi:NADH:ubiquinone oxidoreductase subunit 6 (subunit J)